MGPISQIYLGLSVINIFLAMALIFLERRNATATWAWILVLFFIPGLGFFIYVILGRNLSGRKLYRINQRENKTLNDMVKWQKQKLQQDKLVYQDASVETYRDFVYMNVTTNKTLLTQDNEVEIYTSGKEKFEALFASLEQATDHIHLQYYIFRQDALGARLVDLLVKKAKQGVKVRVLYDDIGSLGIKKNFFDELKQAGGEVAVFFSSPIPYLNFRLNYRNHRKIAVVDGKIGFVGGFNVGNEYLGLDQVLGDWRDTHLRIEGLAVSSLQITFLLDWNLASGQNILYTEEHFPRWRGSGQVALQVVTSGPTSRYQRIQYNYLKMIHSAKKSLYLQTPYFVPDESLLNDLKIAVLSGIDVRIMIPKRSDNRLVQWASSSYIGELLGAGARCYLYEKGFLHAKTMMVDGSLATVGTANLDIRSLKLNFEVNAIIYDSQTSRKLEEIFLQDISHCTELTLEEYNNRPRLLRFQESIARLLSPIL
ncbi:cardiolipin synthase [Brevibacillus laterosporus]|uniref:cardiolipin synthase n=1 Tax=Brevibacillus laterosporus TaxID=1465 RepID=UPI002405AD60|nr:cardiolipin synthase [Brevibacillus laterosporus]MDF9413183.1 cardiolipin synthase [Brevibacillus laterosporus]